MPTVLPDFRATARENGVSVLVSVPRMKMRTAPGRSCAAVLECPPTIRRHRIAQRLPLRNGGTCHQGPHSRNTMREAANRVAQQSISHFRSWARGFSWSSKSAFHFVDRVAFLIKKRIRRKGFLEDAARSGEMGPPAMSLTPQFGVLFQQR